jgi:hypothetical protein
MRFLILLAALLVIPTSRAGEPVLGKAVKASLVFEAEHDPKAHYPHLLKVFLRLENVQNSQVEWTANSMVGAEAELLDPEGKPARQPPTASSITSNNITCLLPYGSKLDWLISHGGVSMAGDPQDKYALIVGGKGWLIPMDTAKDYSLHIRLHGKGGSSSRLHGDPKSQDLLLDLPPVKIKLAK